VALDLDDAGLEGLADLRRGEADSRRVTHRLGHVVEQLVEGLSEAVDRQALEPEARIAEENDGADAHRGSITAAIATAGRAPRHRSRYPDAVWPVSGRTGPDR
jgi:hypothetical protein